MPLLAAVMDPLLVQQLVRRLLTGSYCGSQAAVGAGDIIQIGTVATSGAAMNYPWLCCRRILDPQL
jgi:hypothetical protein